MTVTKLTTTPLVGFTVSVAGVTVRVKDPVTVFPFESVTFTFTAYVPPDPTAGVHTNEAAVLAQPDGKPDHT